MRPTLDQTNAAYFALVRERTEKKVVLDCFTQTRRLLAAHAPVSDCLDVGCASGYLYFHIRDLIGTYHGLDASAKYLDYGKAVFRDEGVSNAVHHLGWFENFSPPQRFDALICLGLFYVFPNYHWYLDQMMAMTGKRIIIRSLFSDRTQYRYVPEMPDSPVWTYYNIYARSEIEGFVRSRGWRCHWHPDDYLARIGGRYETAGLPFPFEFLVITPCSD